MALVNVMEGIVRDKLTEMLKTENCCKCDRCIEDMTALALNKLPARYKYFLNVSFILNNPSHIL